jgi:VIT1/CCC1 family predicted Fe2+/Mn2+ transporter
MALGEYVSVSSQRDSEAAQLAQEQRELAEDPKAELAELVALYRGQGLSEPTAHQVAVELTEHDALAAHLSAHRAADQAQRDQAQRATIIPARSRGSPRTL